MLRRLTLICIFVGGLGLAASAFVDPSRVVSATGAVLWLGALVGCYALVWRLSRRDGIGIARSALRSLKDTLRFAWEFMP